TQIHVSRPTKWATRGSASPVLAYRLMSPRPDIGYWDPLLVFSLANLAPARHRATAASNRMDPPISRVRAARPLLSPAHSTTGVRSARITNPSNITLHSRSSDYGEKISTRQIKLPRT